MEKNLKEIQKLMKAIARSALNAEFNMDVELSVGQWNSWTEDGVKAAVETICKYAESAKKLLK